MCTSPRRRAARNGRIDSSGVPPVVRKLSGFNGPSKTNGAAFDRAIEEVSVTAPALIDALGAL
ncbi:MAG: DUF2277 family protein [Steroidobacterales bacterium]